MFARFRNTRWLTLKSLDVHYSFSARSKIILARIQEFYFLIRPSDRRGIELARYRNMRSKRRCSLCLQFALILGAGPVLHRPTSLVIHRLEWNLCLKGFV